MAADATGLYYESQIGAHSYLVHAGTSGTRVLSRVTKDADSPMALVSGSAVLSATHGSGQSYLDRFAEATLTTQDSSRLRGLVGEIVSNGSALLAIESSCTPATCTSTGVEGLDPMNGAVTETLAVSGITNVLGGLNELALSYRAGHAYLTRLS
jgi:hypothetical protein